MNDPTEVNRGLGLFSQNWRSILDERQNISKKSTASPPAFDLALLNSSYFGEYTVVTHRNDDKNYKNKLQVVITRKYPLNVNKDTFSGLLV